MNGFVGYLANHAFTGIASAAALGALRYTWQSAKDGRLVRRVVMGEAQIESDEGLLGRLSSVKTRVSDIEERTNANQEELERHKRALREGDLLPIGDERPDQETDE